MFPPNGSNTWHVITWHIITCYNFAYFCTLYSSSIQVVNISNDIRDRGARGRPSYPKSSRTSVCTLFSKKLVDGNGLSTLNWDFNFHKYLLNPIDGFNPSFKTSSSKRSGIKNKQTLTSWWFPRFNPFEKYESNWTSSPRNRGEHKKIFQLPPPS